MTGTLRIACALLASATAVPATATPAGAVKNVVLVHGAFADGSGWAAVSDILTKDGYKVTIVQQPETSLEDDISATNRVLDLQDGPTVLVGHSYGGMIITGAGNNAHVKSLVYVAAFQPEVGESLGSLGASKPPAGTSVKTTADGFLYLDPAHYHADFCADLPAAQADFMARSQVFLSVKAASATATVPAWKSKPSFAIVATKDRAINPELERSMYKRSHADTIEIAASHAVYVSQPAAVAALIEKAAR
ncbi:alpha/beta hydrolase [Sphingomonas populi]|uniref:Alpha/beta hydrolase n=1 Tax=Sphingomonas populi TaxID=2484750 RepID=A0A4Q6Y4P2_9SPHN|nr:alpha/beta hydrolase [Sphingomonas populi]RZF64824.1 alpha/beta hydrolase [Sphingomonas populi]